MRISKDLLVAIVKGCGLSLSSTQFDQLWAYHGLLRASNPDLNMTRIHNFENMVLKHYVDSLLVLNFMELPSPLMDMGSGPGLPGIPLKIARPGVAMILAEPRGARVELGSRPRIAIAARRSDAGRAAPGPTSRRRDRSRRQGTVRASRS